MPPLVHGPHLPFCLSQHRIRSDRRANEAFGLSERRVGERAPFVVVVTAAGGARREGGDGEEDGGGRDNISVCHNKRAARREGRRGRHLQMAAPTVRVGDDFMESKEDAVSPH